MEIRINGNQNKDCKGPVIVIYDQLTSYSLKIEKSFPKKKDHYNVVKLYTAKPVSLYRKFIKLKGFYSGYAWNPM